MKIEKLLALMDDKLCVEGRIVTAQTEPMREQELKMETSVEVAEVFHRRLNDRPATTPDLPMGAEGLQELRLVQLLHEHAARIAGIDDAEAVSSLPDEVLQRAIPVDNARCTSPIIQLELAPDSTDVLHVLCRV
jgi:hypothetical protein